MRPTDSHVKREKCTVINPRAVSDLPVRLFIGVRRQIVDSYKEPLFWTVPTVVSWNVNSVVLVFGSISQ